MFEQPPPSVRNIPSQSQQQLQQQQQQQHLNQHRRHSSHLASAGSLQNQRVAAIIQATGHNNISTTGLTNRFHSPAQQQQHFNPQQFYASSAPSSSTQLKQQRQTRPQVPLFSQSTGNIPQTPNMAMHDMDLFDDFTAFEGGSAQTSFASAYSSPAVPTLYDIQPNLSHSSSTNMGTVSPQDIFSRDFSGTAPNSTALTNLTSPSDYNVSPEYNDDFSPFIGTHADLDQALAADPWYPLFPQDDKPNNVDQSPLVVDEDLEETLNSSRRRSASSGSPTSHSAVAGVGARKREKPLPPIIVEDQNDTVAMKRARNTLAARKSRQRKMQKFEDLEDEITKLKAERDHWKNIALRRTGGQ